ncbi:MAG: low molecular weight phosphotyrosine protein phosphatase [Luminiphilus sp.]|nr:low molecular weight phosphotyrosine protein phosphatase [Luminiphilus sp.]
MQFSSLLILCEANICRSPLAEHILRSLTGLTVTSAGLSARTGDPADPVYLEMAKTLGIDLTQHQSRPVNDALLRSADLTLVMTSGHKRRLSGQYPQFSGRIMRLGHWVDGGISISDPHRKSAEAYQQVFKQIKDACDQWSSKL